LYRSGQPRDEPVRRFTSSFRTLALDREASGAGIRTDVAAGDVDDAGLSDPALERSRLEAGASIHGLHWLGRADFKKLPVVVSSGKL
jgi:hypothetical protein